MSTNDSINILEKGEKISGCNFSKSPSSDLEKINLNRLALLGRFASVFSHEIRNSLGKMKMDLDVYKEELEDNPAFEHIYNKLNTEINYLCQLSNEIKQCTHNNDFIPIKINIYALFESIKEKLQHKIRDKGINFHNAAKTSILSDYIKLHTAFLNLFKAITDSVENNGTIEITSHSMSEIVIIVRKLFMPFEFNKTPGSELSLLIFNQLISDLGGSINLSITDDDCTQINILL